MELDYYNYFGIIFGLDTGDLTGKKKKREKHYLVGATLFATMSTRRQQTSVKINELPTDLLEKMLTCMPIQDAVRTSVLSRKWRNIWKKVPKLTFDDNFCTPLIRSSKRKLIEVIYQVLLLHDGPILNFSLSLSDLESCSEIDQFLLVSKRGIKNFTLDILKGENYRLPSSIFSCQQLEHLSLYTCSFRPPAGFKGFSKLVSLELDDVSMDGRLFSSLIRNCPLLESLTIRSLTIYDRLELFAPNLKRLNVEGLWKLLCFKNTPKLASVKVDIGGSTSEASVKVLLSGRLPGVEDLKLDFYYAEYMTLNYAPKLLVPYLCNLKSLCLWDMCFRTSTDVSSISTLITSSPKLEKLVIHAFIDYGKPDSIPINGWDFTLHQLKEVELVDVSGLKCELQFIELLLANSPALEKFVLQPRLEKVADKGLEFFKELSRFQRASPFLKIVYKL